jgi:hypothetical protein
MVLEALGFWGPLFTPAPAEALLVLPVSVGLESAAWAGEAEVRKVLGWANEVVEGSAVKSDVAAAEALEGAAELMGMFGTP